MTRFVSCGGKALMCFSLPNSTCNLYLVVSDDHYLTLTLEG